MDDNKREFIDFMVRAEVLTFGDFVTKSGRKTPFFINGAGPCSTFWTLHANSSSLASS